VNHDERVDRDWMVIGVLAFVYVICLVNAGVAVGFVRGLDGLTPEHLERRYGELRPHLEGVARLVYVTDDAWRFLNARYALAPTVFDHRYVTPGVDGRTIVKVDLPAIVESCERGPLIVLADFGNVKGSRSFVDDLSDTAGERGLTVGILRHTPKGVALVVVGR